MTPLGNELERQLTERGKTIADVAHTAKINPGHLSRFVNGRHRTMKPEAFHRLVIALAPRNPQAQARLVAAHMKNHSYGPGSEYVQVEIRVDKAPAEEAETKTEFEVAIDTLVKRAHQSLTVRDLIIKLSKAVAP